MRFVLAVALALGVTVVPAAAAPADRHGEVHFAGPGREIRLARFPVLWGSETVRLDGRVLRGPADYHLDRDTGRLTLAVEPSFGAVVTVEYSAPAFLRPAPPGATEPGPPPPAPLARRLAAALRAPRAPIVTTPPPPPSAPLREELLSGLRLTEHAETLTGPAGERGQVSYFRADPADPRTAADGREQFQTDLDLRPSAASRLRFSSFLSRESLLSEHAEEMERRRLEFEQTVGRSTAALLWERRRTDGRGVASALDALSISLTHPFGRNLLAESYLALEESLARGRESEALLSLKQQLGSALQARAGMQWRASEYAGATVQSAVTFAAHPGAATVNLGYRQADSERYGPYSRLSGDFSLPVSRALTFTGEASRREAAAYGAIDTFGLGMALRPTMATLLEAAFSESTGALLGHEAAQTVRLTADPTALLKLQLGFDRTDSNRSGSVDSGLWIVTLGEQRNLRFEGYANAHEPRDAEPYRDAFYRVEVRPIAPLAVSGQFRRVLLEDESRGVAGAGATLRLFRGVEVGAGYRRPLEVEGPVPLGRDYRLVLAPVGGLRLFGQYSQRPEDEHGVLLDQTHRTAGLETALGSLTLQGAFTRMEGRLTPDPGTRTDLLAVLTLGGRTRLYGGLRTEDPLAGAAAERERLYRLGISQTAGAAFLMLEGQFGWTLEPGGRRVWDGDEVRAQARLGLRF